MKLKHFGLLAVLGLLSWSCADDKGKFNNGMGEIKASFKSVYSVASAMSTEAESGEMEAMAPEMKDFSVQLRSGDGAYSESWTVAEFPTDKKFPAGPYEMELYYGSIDEEGFDKPYYYGSGKFTVEDAETVNPEIVATLGNSMVSLAYTDAFKQYFTSYSAKVSTAGGKTFDFAADDTRAVYVKPGKVTFQLKLVKSNGVELNIEPDGIEEAKPRTHYRVTFDVNGGEVGDAQLSITFDDATAQEPITVTLSEDLTIPDAPTATAKGFENGQTFNILEGDDMDASVVAVALAGLKSVVLTTASDYLAGLGIPAELDLMTATAEQQALLTQQGLEVKGVWNDPDKFASINFSKLIPNLKTVNGNSTHKFTVSVKDIYDRVIETPISFTVVATAVKVALSNPVKSEAGSCQAAFTMAYNGKKENISFKAMNDYGSFVDAPVKTFTDNGDGTYAVVVTIPDNAANTTVKALYKGTEKASIVVKIGKTFFLSAENYDIWATKAIVKVNAKVADFRKVVIDNVQSVLVNGTATTNYTKDALSYTFTVNGLTPGAQNSIKIVINDEDGDEVLASMNVTTETAAQVANADMESWQAINLGKFYSAGDVKNLSYFDFEAYASGESDIWWTNNNERSRDYSVSRVKVTSAPCVSYTTDVHSGSKAALLYTSGHGGSYASTGLIMYPEGAFAGSMWIGSYSYSGAPGTETHGHSFPSRPASLSFWYKYAPKGTDSFKVWVAVKSGDTILGEATYIPTATSTADGEYKQATVNLNYSVTNKKATTICVQFLSTSKTSFSSGDFDKNASFTFPEMDDWNIHKGSVLKIDDIVLNY